MIPFAREEFKNAYDLESEKNLVEKARKMIVVSFILILSVQAKKITGTNLPKISIFTSLIK
jgi:hypothetical protein